MDNVILPRLRLRMLPGVDVLSCFAAVGVDGWGEKGLGLPDKLPVWPVLVGAGEAEKECNWHKVNFKYKMLFRQR